MRGEEGPWAHSRNGAGCRHSLEDHLRGTAALAYGFADVFGAGELARYLGLVHDVGKAACVWQKGLNRAERDGGRVGTDHKSVGAWLAANQVGSFGLAVQGHHGGIPSWAELRPNLPKMYEAEAERFDEAIERSTAIVSEIARTEPPGLPSWVLDDDVDGTAIELLHRLVSSALFDADFLDTERHFADGAERYASRIPVASLYETFEQRRADFLKKRRATPIDGVRGELYDLAVAAADGPLGIYRMPAPTGSGKTISAGGFALRHAVKNDLRRVIVAVPYISITEQNAQVYRDLLNHSDDEPVVLEHHSGVEVGGRGEDLSGWRRLAAENWDAPFIVTTTVQLFHSLFSNRPSAMRKLHQMAGSVIILDEVQALPDRLLIPILSVLRDLSKYFNTSVLLASATQPAFWDLTAFRTLPGRSVVPDPQRYYDALSRVTYRWLGHKPTFAELAPEIARERQVLAIVNTTANAAELHGLVAAERPSELGPVVHLSTRMVGLHRRDALAQIEELLTARRPVAVVATQLVEAGVDLDFPVVYRALAPADSLQQAAGRANRNGTLREGGRVIVFEPADGGQPRDVFYQAALEPTRHHFGEDKSDPDNIDALAAYYSDRYQLQGLTSQNDGRPRPSHPAAAIDRLREDLNFPEVADRFDFFAGAVTQQVVVTTYGKDPDRRRVRAAIKHLREAEKPGRWALRELQPFIATITRGIASRALKEEKAKPLFGDLLEWLGPYDDQRGVQLQEEPEDWTW